MPVIQVTLSVGTLLRERYLVTSLIGKGVSGAVYLVKDRRVKQAGQDGFALKEVVGLNRQERSRFTFASVALRRLSHRALPRVHHVFSDDKRERVYLVMDYVEGPDLETLWQQQAKQRFAWPEVAQMLAPIFDAVSYLHRQKPPIVHGDIKPVNIILAQPEERFMLVDVGVAREQEPDSSVLPGMPGYQAPEQYGKGVDVRADIYGLGATCYSLLTGAVPTNALVRVTQLERGQTDPLQPANTVVPTVPSHVSRAIQRAMSLRAHERFSSVEEFWQALQTPPKELKPTVDDVVSEAITASPVITEQRRARAAVIMLRLSRRPRGQASPRSLPKGYVVPLLLLFLLVLVGTGAGIWSLARSQHAPSTAANHAALTPPALRSTVPLVTPTSSPGSYPSVVGSYAGTLVDISAKASATMILQGIRQIGGTISGYLTLGSPLEISGPLSGMINVSKRFRFTVTDTAGRPVLFMEGTVQTATILSGDFYRCTPTQGETCVRASEGYGIWSAQLVPSA